MELGVICIEVVLEVVAIYNVGNGCEKHRTENRYLRDAVREIGRLRFGVVYHNNLRSVGEEWLETREGDSATPGIPRVLSRRLRRME